MFACRSCKTFQMLNRRHPEVKAIERQVENKIWSLAAEVEKWKFVALKANVRNSVLNTSPPFRGVTLELGSLQRAFMEVRP